MSDDESQDYFADGLSEELLNLLARTKGLKVSARISSFSFKGQNRPIEEIAEMLKWRPPMVWLQFGTGAARPTTAEKLKVSGYAIK